MNERDIIIDPIITHNNHLIEVAPDDFVNVTQLWEEYKQIVKDKKDLQNRIDKAIELIKNKISTETYQHLKALYDDIDKIEEVWEDYEFDDLLDILKESGE